MDDDVWTVECPEFDDELVVETTSCVDSFDEKKRLGGSASLPALGRARGRKDESRLDTATSKGSLPPIR